MIVMDVNAKRNEFEKVASLLKKIASDFKLPSVYSCCGRANEWVGLEEEELRLSEAGFDGHKGWKTADEKM